MSLSRVSVVFLLALLCVTAAGQNAPPSNSTGPVRPQVADTIRASVYVDNWFLMYINGKPVAMSSIEFLPHHEVSVSLLPEYPMTIAILAKDNADPKTGIEYGNRTGDGGLILKFSDGTVSNATWKAKVFFKGPLNGDLKDPRVEKIPLPANWCRPEFNDRDWPQAKAYSLQEVNPNRIFTPDLFTGAQFIWSEDTKLDNTVIFRATIQKPGWKPRWSTQTEVANSRILEDVFPARCLGVDAQR